MAETTAAAVPLFEARNISKSYGHVNALMDVSFEVREREVVGLLGDNGAGKSTLIKILTGVVAPDAGTLALAGRTVAPRGPLAAQRLGISTVYQEVNLCPNLTVAENIFAGRYPRRGWAGLKAIDGPRMVRRLNIAGDGQGDLAGLGGERRAVFVYQMDS